MHIQVNSDSGVAVDAAPGSRDMRCLMEARPAGRDPVVVTEQAAAVEMAPRGAIQKMDRLLGSDFGRLEARR